MLTGGIASGKSIVSDKFKKLGVVIVDTDIIARQVVEPGRPALSQIANQLGSEFITVKGQLDRTKLRQAVFENEYMRKKLEAILHPAIYEKVKESLADVKSSYCLLVIPLFVESSRYDWVDRVLVVDVPEEVQVQRVMDRDGVSGKQAQSILAAQASREERLAVADDVILNTGSIEELEKRVLELHREYLSLAGC